MTASPILVWFRDDLRIADNPALSEAAATGRPLVCLYVFENDADGVRPPGAAARWWLHHSLSRLAADLATRGASLVVRRGRASDIVPALARETGAGLVVWNRRYGPAAAVDAKVATALRALPVPVRTLKANLLFEPDELRSQSGKAFRVFAAFFRAAMAAGEPRASLPLPPRWPVAGPPVASDPLESLDLLPRIEWAAGLAASWTPGEAGAQRRLSDFIGRGLAGYDSRRDFPAELATSMLSPHLRFGEVSPFQVWDALREMTASAAVAKFRRELAWREFANHVLADFPDLAARNLKGEFDRFPWRRPQPEEIEAWRRGLTGYPIVDAGMRQLWQTGWMHNRVRMIVASFLTRHLLLDWRIGEQWFWDTLVDADAANNPFGWQWVAGSGADAQPFFRIFNPVLQAETFDPDGTYVRAFVPELAGLPEAFIHAPWTAPPLALAAARIVLGRDYPPPIVDHAAARRRALEAFAQIGQKGAKPSLDARKGKE